MKGHRYSTVVMSGIQMPLVAPASTAMLQMVMRASMDMASTLGPANSITQLVAPLTPIWEMMKRITSLAKTPGASLPSSWNLMVLGSLKEQTPFRMPTSRSVVPTPAAKAPKAPWVQVWLSPMMTV